MKPYCEILKKCGGMPLAIVTMASMLACQQTRSRTWLESIHHSLASDFATKSKYDGMMYILDLSYKYLPHELKACFLYLGSYPEDHNIKKVDLVRRWVAEGFVSNSDGQDVWDVAKSYYNELANRSLIQPNYDENIFYSLPIPSCRVHDMLLELIVKRCKEDNFLSLKNDDPHAEPSGQDKVIRRLTVVGFGDAVRNVSQIRSLAMLGSNRMPPLLELKFVRVLHLELERVGGKGIELADINRLSQLRYLVVTSGFSTLVVLPHQIKGLRFLETLDFSGVFIRGDYSFEIIDAPRLSHLKAPKPMRLLLPDRIGMFKMLHTLRGFILPPMDSLENIIGLGELAALSDLEFVSPRRCAPLVEAAWMAALAASLEKLRNLRQLVVMTCPFDDVGCCADALSSLSPPFHNLEQLNLRDWTFSRVPKWIGYLYNLRGLQICAKQILQEDVVIMGTQLPRLLILRLRILGIPTERIVVGGSTGFPALKSFIFDCDMVSYLTFEAGTMPELRALDLVVYVDEWDRAAPGGLQHLPRLEQIGAKRAFSSVEEAHRRSFAKDEALIRGVFQGAADSLPTRPAFKLWGGWFLRPRMEDC
ncbi:hypothetical protein U9M48_041296 [Paspalum notatum var. saurae]|uniref:NB-ARC domain-containing protein n=1 Tax=Paspalum notatum var. saurae TaxID=547442 RepID=A0AAQ3UU65_PASNO